MTYFKNIIIPLTLVFILSIGCENDDICASVGETTPNVIIDFYNFTSQEDKKNVFNLLVVGAGKEEALTNYSFVSTSQIILPLKTTENTTQFILVKEATINDNATPDDTNDDFVEGNYDTITLNYSRENVFVSRACGYKTVYKNVTLTIENDSDNWILSQTPLNPNQSVEDENTTHFNIYH